MSEETDRSDGPGRKRWVGMLQLGSVFALTILALYFMRTPKPADLSQVSARPATGPVQVEVVRPLATQRTLRVDLTGTVSLHGTVGLRPQVAGRAIWVSPKLRNGGIFAAGEMLLRIDPEDFEIAVRTIEGRVREQRGRMRQHELEGEAAGIEYQRSHPGQAVPAIVLHEPQVARFKGTMDEELARLAGAKLALSRTRFSLPFNGKVVTSQVEVGSLVGPGRAFGAAYPLTAIQVDAAVALDDLAQLEPALGRSAEVRIGGRILSATVERVSAGVDPRSRMATLFLRFTEAVATDALPLPGMFVEVSVAGRALNDVFALPDTAERPAGGVWVVDDGVLRSASPQSFGHDRSGWIVAAFDAADGIVVGPVPGGAEGLAVKPVLQGGDGS